MAKRLDGITRKVIVTLTVQQIVKAKEIGSGNVAAGVRLAIEQCASPDRPLAANAERERTMTAMLKAAKEQRQA